MNTDDTSKPPAWWPEGAKASMNPPERSEVTDLNQPAQWFEITATPKQLEQLRQQHAWKINYQYITGAFFIETAAPSPTPQNLAEAADRFNDPGPYCLTVHTSQHGRALLALVETASKGLVIHLHLSDHLQPGQWYLSADPLPDSRPAPTYDEDEE